MKNLLFAGMFCLGSSLFAQTYVGMAITAPTPPTADAGTDTVVLPGTPIQLNGNATGGTAPLSYQWLPAIAVSNPSISNPVATVNSTTPLTLVVTDANGCKDTALVTIFVSGLGSQETALTFGISPNPGSGWFNFEAPLQTSGTISLIDVQGAVLKRQTYDGGTQRLDYSNFAQGIYTVLFETASGSSVQRISILKP
jgi:hypothetical protein